MDAINELYQKRGYMDRYGIHVWVSLITCVAFFLAIGYYYVNNHMKSLESNWEEVRCNPLVMPFAGMVHREGGMSAQQNFESCLSDTMQPLAKASLSPLKSVSRTLVSDLRSAGEAIADLNEEMDDQEEEADDVEYSFTDELNNRMNSSIILLRKFKDIGTKLNGVTYLLTYELQGTLYTISSVMKKLIKMGKALGL